MTTYVILAVIVLAAIALGLLITKITSGPNVASEPDPPTTPLLIFDDPEDTVSAPTPVDETAYFDPLGLLDVDAAEEAFGDDLTDLDHDALDGQTDVDLEVDDTYRVRELRPIAKAAAIPDWWNMNKADLITAINEAD